MSEQQQPKPVGLVEGGSMILAASPELLERLASRHGAEVVTAWVCREQRRLTDRFSRN